MTIRKILLSLFLATSATAWLSPHPALAWSSIDQKGFFGALATHQYLNEKAYSVLKKHPAFKESGFPSLAEIQYYSGVNAKVEGPGPDGEGNTRYAWHYYNPVTRKGKAPETVDRYQGYLLRNLVDGEKTVDEENHKDSPPARNAAYAAHFIQDMTCPFHVSGIPADAVNPARPGVEREVGPYGHVTDGPLWKELVRRFEVGRAPYKDWFDPAYYDGKSVGIDDYSPWTLTSTHVLYEGLVELYYKNDPQSVLGPNDRDLPELANGYAFYFYDKGKVREMVDRLAKQTKDDIGTTRKPGYLWFDADNMVFSETGRPKFDVPVIPWRRAIQATLAVWRGTFTAILIKDRDMSLVKVKNKPNVFELKVKVTNLDNGPAFNVKLEVEANGTDLKTRTVSVGEIPAGGAVDVLCGEITVPPEGNGGAVLKARATVVYRYVPDAGERKVEITVGKLRKENAVKMPAVTGMEGKRANGYLNAEPYRFAVNESNAGPSETRRLAHTVAQQSPEAGLWVAPGDDVTVSVYEEAQATVPSVVGQDQKTAIGMIRQAELSVAQVEQQTEAGTAPGIIIGQSPGAGERVPLDTVVTITVSKPKKPEVRQSERIPAGDALEAVEELVPEELSGPPVVGRLIIEPGSAAITTSQAAAFTVRAVGLDGKPLSPQALSMLVFAWIPDNPSLANVSGNGNTAVLSPIGPGKLRVVCTAGGAMGIATVVITDDGSSDFEDSDGEWVRQESVPSVEQPVDAGYPQEQVQPPRRRGNFLEATLMFMGGMANVNAQSQRIQNIRAQQQQPPMVAPMTVTPQNPTSFSTVTNPFNTNTRPTTYHAPPVSYHPPAVQPVTGTTPSRGLLGEVAEEQTHDNHYGIATPYIGQVND